MRPAHGADRSSTAPATSAEPASSRLGRPGRLPRRRLPADELPELPFDDRAAVPQRGRPRHRRRRRAPAGDLRHRLDQARPGRPHRPHQGRRRTRRSPPARDDRVDRADRRAARAGWRSTSTSPSAASTWRRSTDWERLDQHEIALGEAEGRQRVKIPDRAGMLRAGRVSGRDEVHRVADLASATASGRQRVG